jgi:RNA polymerase sigma-70 factor (ECF subfamily)
VLPQTATTDMANVSDFDFAQRIAAGDRDALQRLMRRYNQRLYRTARSILKDDAEAEDALQDAYVLAYKAMGRFRGGASLATWLVRIVVNEAVRRMRKCSRRAELIQLDGTVEQLSENPGVNMIDASQEQPEAAVLRAETRRLLEHKIDLLPDVFRTVFNLRAVEDMSVDETAACLGIPSATVRTRYFRARGLLRESLAREIDFNLEHAFAFDGDRCDRIVAGVLARIENFPPSTA